MVVITEVAAALLAATEVEEELEAGMLVWTRILPVCPPSPLPARPSLSKAMVGGRAVVASESAAESVSSNAAKNHCRIVG